MRAPVVADNINKKAWIAAAAMLVAMLAREWLSPEKFLADTKPLPQFAQQVPASFGDWQSFESEKISLVSPQTGKVLANTYDKTLSRTYLNSTGASVMLSLAYGGRQQQGLRIHRQEVCYETQGFAIRNKKFIELVISGRRVHAVRFDAISGGRHEAVVYWLTMGDAIVQGYLDRQVTQLRYSVSGLIPDGYLYRVSTIGVDSARNDALLRQFMTDFFRFSPAVLTQPLLGDEMALR